jgi:DNA-binding transcriptional MocR family regulator
VAEWKPDIASRRGRRYLAIADALADDIKNGVVRPGDRLPTHRELAYQMGLSVSTVSKAYAEAVRRQLILSEVGRGTFVMPNAWTDLSRIGVDSRQIEPIDMAFNCPVPTPMLIEAMSEALKTVSTSDRLDELMPYYRPWIGLSAHRTAGASWIEKRGLKTSPENILITNGAQHAAAIILTSLLEPNQIVVTEELTDPGIKFLTANRSLQLKGLAMDRDGLLPDAFEAACRSMKVRALITVPNHHSPTLTIMPVERRKAIAEIAIRYGAIIIEDDVYGPFLETPPPALSSFAPGQSFYFTSLSKCICPGLRIGFLAAPPGRTEELIPGLGATTWMASMVPAEIAALWIRDGTAERLTAWQRQEMGRRQKLASQILEGFGYASLPTSLHLWLPLPDSWRAESFVAQARARGLAVTPAEAFVVGHVAAPQAIRISMGGATPARTELQRGLEIVADLLRERPAATYLVL